MLRKPDLMNETFYLRQNYCNLRTFNAFARNNSRSKFLSDQTVYQVNELWQTLPPEITNCSSLQLLRVKSKLGAVRDVSVKFTHDFSPK